MPKTDLLYNPEKVYDRKLGFTSSVFEKFTPFLRCMPDFFIGGIQKGGTTSLYYSIIQHPQVIPSKTKEVFYYGTTYNYEKGLSYYKKFFSSVFYKAYAQLKLGKPMLCLDATSNIFDSKEAPARILKDNPKAKMVFILRNPTERAFSHYKMAKKNGWDLADFEQALALEEERIRDGVTHKLASANHNLAYQRLGYRSRGIYVNQMKHWLNEFPNEQLLILSSEDFFKNPDLEFSKLCKFLGIDSDVKIEFKKLNEGDSGKMSEETRNRLNEFYKPYNEELFKLLNTRYEW